MGYVKAFLKMRGTNQAIFCMRADVHFVATNGFMLTIITDLLMLVEGCPGRKRKEKHPQHKCGQYSFYICAFSIHPYYKFKQIA